MSERIVGHDEDGLPIYRDIDDGVKPSSSVGLRLTPAVICALAARRVRGDFYAFEALRVALRVLGDEAGEWQDQVRRDFRWYLEDREVDGRELDGRELRHLYPDAWHDGDKGDIPLDDDELATYRLLRELMTGEG